MSRRQQRGEATAGQLLSAARQVFEERGYQATTVGAITEAAATAHGTFYLYFRNKEDAFAKVMAGVLDDMYREATASWAGDVVTTVRRAVGGAVGVYLAHRGLWRCLLEAVQTSPAVERMWLDLRRAFVDRVARLLSVLVERGQVRPLDPRLSAYALTGMVEWSAFSLVELGEPDVPADALVETLTDLWVHAVYGGATLARHAG